MWQGLALRGPLATNAQTKTCNQGLGGAGSDPARHNIITLVSSLYRKCSTHMRHTWLRRMSSRTGPGSVRWRVEIRGKRTDPPCNQSRMLHVPAPRTQHHDDAHERRSEGLGDDDVAVADDGNLLWLIVLTA